MFLPPVRQPYCAGACASVGKTSIVAAGELISFGASLQREIHRVEPLQGCLEQRIAEAVEQEPGEPLRVMEAARLAALLEAKHMLAIKEAGQEKSAEPAQFTLARRNLHD